MNFKQIKVWLKWKMYIRFSENFSNLKIFQGISLKKFLFLLIGLTIFRDTIIVSFIYLFISWFLKNVPVGLNFATFIIFINLIPDLSAVKDNWKWQFFSKDYEFGQTATPLSISNIRYLHFLEDVLYKSINYITSFIPIIIILLSLSGVKLLDCISVAIFLLIYKVCSIWILSSIFQLLFVIFSNAAYIQFNKIKNFLMIIFTSFTGYFIGVKLVRVLFNIYEEYQKQNDINYWTSSILNMLKIELIKFFNYFHYPNIFYTKRELLYILMLLALVLLFITKCILQIIDRGVSSIDNISSESIYYENITDNNSLFSKIIDKIIYAISPHSGVAINKFKIIRRNPYFITNPLYYLGAPINWLKFFFLVGLLSFPNLNSSLRILLFIQVGVVISKDELENLFRKYHGVFNFDSLGKSTELFVISTFKLYEIAKININIVKCTVILPIVIKILILLTITNHFYEVVITACYSFILLMIMSNIYQIPGYLLPHFESRNTQQIGKNFDQGIIFRALMFLESVLESIALGGSLLFSIGWINNLWLCFIIFIITILGYFILNVLISKIYKINQDKYYFVRSRK